MNKVFENILEQLESTKDIEHDDSVAEVLSTRIWNKAIHRAKQIVNEVAEEYNGGWIACSERLPDKAGYEVIATLENGYGQRRVTIIFTGYGDSQWHCNHKEFDLDVWKVIAWQPLPEPYKERDRMNDRYLFRAKHSLESKKWNIGNLVEEPDGLYLRDNNNDIMVYIQDHSTICQCTGLKDKNGNLIWENDVVQYCDCAVENYVIVWEADKACF